MIKTLRLKLEGLITRPEPYRNVNGIVSDFFYFFFLELKFNYLSTNIEKVELLYR